MNEYKLMLAPTIIKPEIDHRIFLVDQNGVITETNKPTFDQTNSEDNLKSKQPTIVNLDDEDFLSNLDDLSQLRDINIKIFGVGGAGCNVVQHLINTRIFSPNIKIYALNTDKTALLNLKGIRNLYLLGKNSIRGAGSGGDPQIGKMSVEESQDDLRSVIKNTDMLFLVAGFGKGTGSGATPEIARIAKELGILTIAIVNLPSIYAEGSTVYKNALGSLENLKKSKCSITTISNDKIISKSKNAASFIKAYALANQEVSNIIDEIIKMVVVPTDINVDLADITNFFNNNLTFMANCLEIEENFDKDKLKNKITETINNSFNDVNVKQGKKIILNYTICSNTPTSLISDTREIFKTITSNNDLTVVTGVDYSGKEKVKISFLLAASESNNSQLESEYSRYNSTFDQSPAAVDNTNFETGNLDLDEYRTVHVEHRTNSKIEKNEIFFDEFEDPKMNSEECIKIMTKAITKSLNSKEN